MRIEAESCNMSDGRALLTDREREALTAEETGSYRYKTRTYLRNRLEELEHDVEILEHHEPELFEQLQAIVCNEAPAGNADETTAERDEMSTSD